MSLKNLEDRIEKLEKVRGVNKPQVVITVHFIKGDGKEEFLTLEETAALEAHEKQLFRDAEGGPNVPCILWTREQARKLLTQTDQDPSGEGEGNA